MKANSFIKTTCLISLAGSVVVANTAGAVKLYKWVDSRGRISYQDQPPPKNAKVLSEKELKAQTSPEAELLAKANTTPIDVYVAENCSSCDDLLAELDELNVPYNSKSINEHRDIQDRIIQETDGLTIPAVFISDILRKTPTVDTLKQILKETGYQINKPSEEASLNEELEKPKEPSVPK